METEEDSDIIFKAARKDIHLNEEECLSIAKDLGYIFDDSELEDYSSIESRERFRQYKTWRELVKLKTVRPKTLETIKRILGIVMKQLEDILKRWDIRTGREFLCDSLLFWLMMPRFKYDDAVKDPLSTVGQLSPDLEQMCTMTIGDEMLESWEPWCFWKDFRRVFDCYIEDLGRSSRSRFWMALQRDLWLAIIRVPDELYIERKAFYLTSPPDDLSQVDVCDGYRELLFDIHNQTIKLSRFKLTLGIQIRYFNMITDSYNQVFLAERTKLIELVLFRELMYNDGYEFDRIEPSGAICETLAAQTSISLMYSFGKPARWTTRSQGIQSVKLLVLVLCRRMIKNNRDVESYHISQWVRLLRHLELAYECRRSQEYPHDKHHLLPTCVELAFTTPFENPKSCKHVCEFTFSRDILDHLDRNIRGARILKEAKRDREIEAGLQYYQHVYDGLELCCSTIDRSINLKFRCVGHYLCQNELGKSVCPLLKRQFFCHPDACNHTDPDCSARSEPEIGLERLFAD